MIETDSVLSKFCEIIQIFTFFLFLKIVQSAAEKNSGYLELTIRFSNEEEDLSSFKTTFFGEVFNTREL